MNVKRMAELSGIPGLVEALEDAEVTITRFPEVTQVSGFVLDWPGPDVERTLGQIHLPALSSNIDRAAFRLSNLGVLILDAQGAAWNIYLKPHASDADVAAAIEQARQALVPSIERAQADHVTNYRKLPA